MIVQLGGFISCQICRNKECLTCGAMLARERFRLTLNFIFVVVYFISTFVINSIVHYYLHYFA